MDYLFKSSSYVNKIMFMPGPSTYSDSKRHLLWIPTSKRTPLPLPAVYVQVSNPEYIIIYSHGNAMDIGYVDYMAEEFQNTINANFFGFEYTGYGLATSSGESPSEYTAERDMRAAYHFVREELKWPADRIILYGQSIGSGVACYGANYAKLKLGEDIMALILHSGYTSIRQLAVAIAGFAGSIIANRFNNQALLRKGIDCPLLLSHGNVDEVIPHTMSEQLFESAKSPLKHLHIAERRGHNDMSIKHDLAVPFVEKILINIPPRTSAPPPATSHYDYPFRK